MEALGVPYGHLTKKGHAESFRMGRERRKEYIEKKLFPYKYNASSFLTLTSFSPKSRDSGLAMIRGMYPLYDLENRREVFYITSGTPILNTSFDHIIQEIYYESGEKVCLPGPVQQVHSFFDVLTNTISCENLDAYLYNQKFDMDGLEGRLVEEFGADEI